jgi:hypothetical protein
MIGALMAKRYDEDAYHCVHFAVDMWKFVTGHDLSSQFSPLLSPEAARSAPDSVWRGFEELGQPGLDPLLVLLRGPGRQPHIGVYRDGRIWHMRETGPVAETLAQIVAGYPEVRFFAWTG